MEAESVEDGGKGIKFNVYVYSYLKYTRSLQTLFRRRMSPPPLFHRHLLLCYLLFYSPVSYTHLDVYKRQVCRCENPCTTSSCGRMIYIYPEKNLRAYPGVERGSVEWDEKMCIRDSIQPAAYCSKAFRHNKKVVNILLLH